MILCNEIKKIDSMEIRWTKEPGMYFEKKVVVNIDTTIYRKTPQ